MMRVQKSIPLNKAKITSQVLFDMNNQDTRGDYQSQGPQNSELNVCQLFCANFNENLFGSKAGHKLTGGPYTSTPQRFTIALP